MYNSDDNMTIIIKLVNAIDGYIENRLIARDILIDQIKMVIRQICWKKNNLH